jgi:hypothetical protein
MKTTKKTVYANEPEYSTSKQSASEKKLFAELKELRTAVEDLRVGAKAWVTAIDEQYRRMDVVVRVLGKEVQALKQTTTPPAKPKPEDYVLTDADWQRVITEGWLCEFWDTFEKPQNEMHLFIGQLVAKPANGKFLRKYSPYYSNCRPLNKPGVLQPYFGQGMPVKAGTKVLVKQRCGLYSIGKALEQDWNNINHRSDIVSFMILDQQ